MRKFLFRLVRGDGEIIEEIVSRDRHNEINKVKVFYDQQRIRIKKRKSHKRKETRKDNIIKKRIQTLKENKIKEKTIIK